MKNTSSGPSMLSRAVFGRLLLLAIVCFSVVWIIDYNSGIIASFDAFAYPICISSFSVVYLLTITKKAPDQYLHLVTYSVVAGYLIASSIWHHMATNGIFSNAAQWLGLNYVIAYLFLEVRKAILMTILAFSVTVIGHFIALIQHYSIEDTLGVVLNIAVAHIVYIVLLWTVIQLRSSENKAQQQVSMLEHYAYIDPLTRILNRRGLEKVTQELEQEFHLGQQEFAILLLDIDYFKDINDRYGHLKGDDVLTNIASLLSRKINPKDIIGRWGGEEFIIYTMNQSRKEIFDYANSLRELVSKLVIGGITVTVSVGVGYSQPDKGLSDIFYLADQHLYAAKKAGRNTVVDRISNSKESENGKAGLLVS
ncbi:putative diguanylate cyclase YdaM [Marinomonas spartinae]|uniref:diguanylate cyclase n=1 Tax=Marinomonas spartinae TaxID=1792290 RepID=A0A1A8TUG7_9GAMM|nr:GGDEF domain-containing protein [Marinomonas spartinae]SBS30553.1 putative diguanylate cyclase YdaM [Marinomonas spartinae]SBS37236.1 putative diguanylate cyclase YdaM [Marinomonas spartinae]